MLKKDKEKVLDEVWTTERVRDFLNLEAPAGVNADFHVLINAYRSMRIENFEQFLTFFQEANRDVNAKDAEGQTTLAIVNAHRKGDEYAAVLKQHGAA
ncbi:Uncharacterised protein [BD1-7 clade bacterium]|uniref:Aminopeptidase N n=1 Tax=BD1-7 clade bacterium TaxID=2029982 RepID=A0A5S9MRE0_9GAMM|nr:Uncharacterised protein [BD1-7 clade bacterium]CAA0084738.1 Uncharacterised protein [BD1-7 clade bacterium]